MVWRVSTQNWLEEACNENMPSSAVVGLSADSNLSAEIILSYASGEPGHRLPGAWVLLLRPYRDGVFASHNGDLRGLMMSPDLDDPQYQ